MDSLKNMLHLTKCGEELLYKNFIFFAPVKILKSRVARDRDPDRGIPGSRAFFNPDPGNPDPEANPVRDRD
jgi:hypothetical protein